MNYKIIYKPLQAIQKVVEIYIKLTVLWTTFVFREKL